MTKAMKHWSISSIELCKEAEKLWLTVEIVSKNKNLFYISSEQKKVLFKSTDFWGNTALGFKICQDKWLTYDLLERHHLPIAKSLYVSKSDFQKSNDIDISMLKMPIIIKPLDEAHGNGVMMNIQSKEELTEKLNESFKMYDNMIIQEQAYWDEVRVFVVKGDVLLAQNRIPAHVIWDWKLTIQELIEKENSENPLRWEWYESPLSYIKVDWELLAYISKQDQSLDYIPEKWQYIQLRWNSNIGTWGTMINVTDIMHPETKEICIKAAKVIGLQIAGVDILAMDVSKKLDEQWWIILEVNATPGIWGERQVLWVNSAYEILKRVFDL